MSDDDAEAMTLWSAGWAQAMAESMRIAARIADMSDSDLAEFRGRLRADPDTREEIAADLADTQRILSDLLAVVEIAERRLLGR